MLLKPFVLVAWFFVVYLIARSLSRLIPGGRIKDILYDRTIQKRHPWKFGIAALVGTYGTICLMVYLLIY